jgi:predicted nucleic acid-binding protein
MKVLYDINVLLDALLRREPFYQQAAQLLAAAEQSRVHAVLCSSSITTLHYLAAKQLGPMAARQVIERLLQIFDLAVVNRLVLQSALTCPIIDFEDAVVSESAYHAEVDGIVTRDLAHFRNSSVRIYSPEELLAWLARQGAED